MTTAVSSVMSFGDICPLCKLSKFTFVVKPVVEFASKNEASGLWGSVIGRLRHGRYWGTLAVLWGSTALCLDNVKRLECLHICVHRQTANSQTVGEPLFPPISTKAWLTWRTYTLPDPMQADQSRCRDGNQRCGGRAGNRREKDSRLSALENRKTWVLHAVLTLQTSADLHSTWSQVWFCCCCF